MQKDTTKNAIQMKCKRPDTAFGNRKSKYSFALFNPNSLALEQTAYPKKENRKPTKTDRTTPHKKWDEKKLTISCPEAKPAPKTVPQ